MCAVPCAGRRRSGLLADGLGFGYWGAVLIAILVLAFLPTLCSLLIGYAVAFVSGRMRHKALVANIAYFLFIAAIFAGTFWLQTGMQKVAVDRQGLTAFPNQWLQSFYAALASFGRGWLGAAPVFCTVSVAFFWVWCFFSVRDIAKLYRDYLPTKSRKLPAGAGGGGFGTVSGTVPKRTSALFWVPGLCSEYDVRHSGAACGRIAALLFNADVRIVLAQLQLEGGSSSFADFCCVCAFYYMYHQCQHQFGRKESLDSERGTSRGKNDLFYPKLRFSCSLLWPGLLVAGICAAMAFRLSVVHTVLLLLTCFLYSLGNALWGLLINLLLPKMDCENDTVIVKRSASVMVTSLGEMLIAVVIGAICWFHMLLGFFPGSKWYFDFAQCGCSCCVCWTWILRRGAQSC